MEFEQFLAPWRAQAPVLAGSAAVVLLMVAIAWVLGFRRSAALDEAALQRLAAAEGAQVEAWLIGPRGRAALARLSGGRIMIARVMGQDVSARVAPAAGVRFKLRNGRVEAAFGDLGYPPLNMRIAQQPAWLVDLAAGDNP